MSSVTDKIAEHNPWYTDDQTPDAPHHRRGIENRNRIILGVTREYEWWREAGQIIVLDAGCGDGHLLRKLAENMNLDRYGFDYNPVRVENARRNAPGAIVSQRDLTKLDDLTPEFFDIVILSQVLEHITEDEKELAGLVRLLRTGGIMVVGVPNEGCLMGKLRNRIFERSILASTDHVHFYTEQEVRGKLEKVGLKIVRTEYEGIMLPRQEIGNWLSRQDWGYKLCQWLGNHVKLQCAGYYFICEKETSR